MPLKPQMTLQPFEEWAIDFVGPITPLGKIGAWHIITAIEYLTRWAEAQPIKDCTVATTTKFLFKNVLTRFGCSKILMSDHGMHFLSETIRALTDEFQIYHQQSTLCHPQENGTVEAFNKILETTLTKVCQTPFWLVYNKEAIMPMEYIVPSLQIAAMAGMLDRAASEKRIEQLEELEEERFLARFHQQVQK
eukprot:PITA_17443